MPRFLNNEVRRKHLIKSFKNSKILFLLNYSDTLEAGWRAGPAPFIVNHSLEIIFNGLFEVHISGGYYQKSPIPRRAKN
jgi:hypothetical protein